MDEEKNVHWVLNGFNDQCKIPIICQVVKLIKNNTIKDKTFRQFAFDLLEVHFKQTMQFGKDEGSPIFGNFGKQFKSIFKEPLTYI